MQITLKVFLYCNHGRGPAGVGGPFTYKGEGGPPTNVSNQRAISDNFLAKKGLMGDRFEKLKVIGCRIVQNLDDFNKLLKNFCYDFQFFSYF